MEAHLHPRTSSSHLEPISTVFLGGRLPRGGLSSLRLGFLEAFGRMSLVYILRIRKGLFLRY